MYKRILFTAFCCFFVCQTGISQLVFNQYSTLLLDSSSYGSTGQCAPMIDVYFSLDASADTIATGMEVVLVISGVIGPVTVGGTTPSVGDTIRFDTVNAIPVSFASNGLLSYEWWAVGTPTVLNEPYFCNWEALHTVAGCLNSAFVWPMGTTQDCRVDLANGRERGNFINDWTAFPNPAQDFIRLDLDGHEAIQSVRLLDLKGLEVRKWTAAEILQVDDLPEGLYLLEVQTEIQVGHQKIWLRD